MVLDASIAGIPKDRRPVPDDETPNMIVRSGAACEFIQACRERGVGFSVGLDVDARVPAAVDDLDSGWAPAVMGDGEDRERAFVAEITEDVDISGWARGSRLIARVEPFYPGAQMSLHNTSFEGERVTCFFTDDTRADIAAIELYHRLGPRVEGRVRQARATGIGDPSCYEFALNAAGPALLSAAVALICWNTLLAFKNTPSLARTEIASFRHCVLGVAARIAYSGRRHHLRFGRCWPWSADIAAGFARQRGAFERT